MTGYRTILADPPWPTAASWNPKTGERKPLPYPTMTVAEISALPVRELAADAAHLYLWTTNRYVPDAYAIARAWGFRPSTLLTWVKKPMWSGLGGAHVILTEHMLFCRRGVLPHKQREPRNWFEWPRQRGHSKKPDASYELIERVSPGPYLELFARRARPGWDVWGNEAPGCVELPGMEIAA